MRGKKLKPIRAIKESRWLFQYLRDEDMYYLVEETEMDGVIGEHFFETEEEAEEYIEENKLDVIRQK